MLKLSAGLCVRSLSVDVGVFLAPIAIINYVIDGELKNDE